MRRALPIIFCLAAVAAVVAQESSAPPATEVIISVADQRLALVRDGGVVEKYRVSTSKFGLGDSFYSYKTPAGRLRVCDKIGDSLDQGTVIRNRSATGEVLAVNAPGRDPIVTRILWLEGLEDQNRNAKPRGIYIHGTPEERTLGEPKSWGCIRMRSSDVVKLFDEVPVGTQVSIIPGHLPHLEKYHAPEPVIVASNTRPAAAATPASSPVSKLEKLAPSESITATANAGQPEQRIPVSANQKVLSALKGSILMAGLPNAPTYGSVPHVAAQDEKNTAKQ